MESAGCKTLLAPSSCDNEAACRRGGGGGGGGGDVGSGCCHWPAPAATAHLNPIKYTNIFKHKHNQQSTKIFFRMYIFGEL